MISQRFTPKTYKASGRNEPCLCGSGKKTKHCCLPKLKIAEANIRDAIEEMRKRVNATAREALDKFKREGKTDNFTEQEKAAMGLLAGCEIVPDTTRAQEGHVTFKLRWPIAVVERDGKLGVIEYKGQNAQPENK